MSTSICKLAVLCLFLIKTNFPMAATNITSILANATKNETSNECTIALYTEDNLKGGRVIISNEGTNVETQEHSAETTGDCCWRVYR